MKGGKKKSGGGSSTDAVQQSPLPPPVADGGGEVDAKAVNIGDEEAPAAAGTMVEGQDEQKLVEQRQEEGEGGEEEGSEEGEEEEEDDEEGEEGEKGYDKFEHLQIEEGEGEAERPKLAEGFYEIEAVRRKRNRKGEVQYLIKWRGWPETSNTWEPLENLLSCSDVIDAFEESLQSGKHRSSRRRKRKYSGTHTQSKKKQQNSPAAASYNVPAVKVRISEEPLPMAPLDNLSFANEGEGYLGGVNNVGMDKQAKENGFGMVPIQIEETEEQNELNLKLSELRGALVTTDENVDKFAVRFQEVHALEGDGPTNGLSEQGQPGRCIGAKRRKSGSVKRFKQDSALCVPNDAQNATARVTNGPSGRARRQGSQYSDFVGNGMGNRNKLDISKNMSIITEIIKPVSYSSSVINNVQDVSVTFMAMRSDGKEVMVDNKFLKANHPLLLINFYEQHLRYSPTP